MSWSVDGDEEGGTMRRSDACDDVAVMPRGDRVLRIDC